MATERRTAAEDLEAEADLAAARRDVVTAERLLSAACAEDTTSFTRWLKLAAVRRAAGSNASAMDALSRALALNPLDFTALLLRASLLESSGRDDDAVGEAYRRALANRPPAEAVLPPGLEAAVARAHKASADYVDRQDRRIRTAAADAGAGESGSGVQARIDRFRTNMLRKTRSYPQQPTLFDYPGLRHLEFMERADLPFIATLEAATAVIEREFHTVFKLAAKARIPYIDYRDDAPLAQWAELNRSERWSAIHLIRNGEVLPEAEHCPETMRAFAAADQPHIHNMSPNLMFSLLGPGTRIPPHTGVSNTRIVFHLPLIVPAGCGFRVGDETREWRRGEAFAFDDTIEHEAWNDSDELRVIVIADMWRPELSAEERRLATAMMVAAGIGGGQI